MDHVHFQYNGFLIGILILSVSCVRKEQNLLAAALYTSLVMFKHLFVVMAPLFFVYMLRNYCFEAAEKETQAIYTENSSRKILSSRLDFDKTYILLDKIDQNGMHRSERCSRCHVSDTFCSRYGLDECVERDETNSFSIVSVESRFGMFLSLLNFLTFHKPF